MIDATANNLPWLRRNSQGEATDGETTPGGEEAAKWVVIRTNISPGEAVVIRGRLESEGIPAVVQQEAVGRVLGLTVGPLGSARVLVPEALAEQALEILAETFEVDEEEPNEG
ncbi:MAG: DUF2007 domain-containing protein [Anaerolineae bacterium]|nr:DUF2007 domain-containing protein [Anaerolineae bacterium]